MLAVDRILPSLSSNRGLLVPQGTTVILGPDRLALTDPDTPPEALSFALSQAPQYGKLLLAGSALTSGSNFTQKNIQELEVAYQHNGGSSQIDRFGFTASDGTARGFLLDGRLQTAPVFFAIQVAVNHFESNLTHPLAPHMTLVIHLNPPDPASGPTRSKHSEAAPSVES